MRFFHRIRHLSRAAWAALIFTIFWNLTVYSGSRAINGTMTHYDLTLPIDRYFPFLPWTAFIYLGCYLFWGINYCLAAAKDTDDTWRFFSADFLAKGCCLLCFLLLPTTNVRPAVDPAYFWDRVMALIYQIDAADNLFPSIHCLVSWFSYIAVRRNPNIPKGYRLFSLCFALAVCISTLTTRQHVFVDTIAGVLLAEGCYHFTSAIHFDRLYNRIFSGLNS